MAADDANKSRNPSHQSVLRWRVLLVALLGGIVVASIMFWLLGEQIGQMIEGCGSNIILGGRPNSNISVPPTTPLIDKFGRQTQVVNYTFYADKPFEFTLIRSSQQGATTPVSILSHRQYFGHANKLEVQFCQVGDELTVTDLDSGKAVATLAVASCARLDYYQGQTAAGTRHISGQPWQLFEQTVRSCNEDIAARCTILP